VARALCNWLAQQSRSGRALFMNIKPGSLHSMWYSQSEARYREVFRVAREAGRAQPDIPVIMFFDEIDSIGASRGAWNMPVDNRVLNAFMAELDGLESRGNIVVLAATNRVTALDPALLRSGRLFDRPIEIPRPNMKAARAILGKHLPVDIPYDRDGRGAAGVEARERIMDSVISRLYAKNEDSELAKLVLRDGSQRPVRSADLMNGACIAQIANNAIERACTRESETGEEGVRLEDVLSSAEEQCAASLRALTPHNCRDHLSGIPDDVDVVSIVPTAKKIASPHSYLNLRAA